jgi:hypothetical protein
MADDKTQVVQMRLQPKTMERIQSLVDLTGTTNKTQLISSSIELTEEILKSVKQGGNVYIEGKDGKKELLKIIGL